MNARSRKKKFYRRSFYTIDRTIIKAYAKAAKDIRAWHLIKRHALRAFGNEYSVAWDWFITPNPNLDGMRPVDLVRIGNVRSVREYLIRLEYCVYI